MHQHNNHNTSKRDGGSVEEASSQETSSCRTCDSVSLLQCVCTTRPDNRPARREVVEIFDSKWNGKLFLFVAHKLTNILCAFVPHRSNKPDWVHGGSSEGWMGHEPIQAGRQPHQLGDPELCESTVMSSLSGSLPTRFGLRLTENRCLRTSSLTGSSESPCWASCDLKLESSELLHSLCFWDL